MKLILQKDVKNLGKAGDQVLVKKGYARNFLIPQGQALPVNKDRLKAWKHQKVIIEAKKRKALIERKTLIEKLSSVKLQFEKESLKDGKLFGSVSTYEISQALETLHNISVDKKDISTGSLKTVGDHKITIHLDSENKAELNLNIKGKSAKKIDQKEKIKEEPLSLKEAQAEALKQQKELEEKELAEQEKAQEKLNEDNSKLESKKIFKQKKENQEDKSVEIKDRSKKTKVYQDQTHVKLESKKQAKKEKPQKKYSQLKSKESLKTKDSLPSEKQEEAPKKIVNKLFGFFSKNK